jgi:hypothetical protein
MVEIYMKKIKLYAIGNDGKYNYYIFDKKQEVVEVLSKVLSKVFSADIKIYFEYHDKKEKWISKKRNFEKIKDIHETIFSPNEDNRIDVFYGDKKIFVTILCSSKLREKFNLELGKVSVMPKPKKVKSRKN